MNLCWMKISKLNRSFYTLVKPLLTHLNSISTKFIQSWISNCKQWNCFENRLKLVSSRVPKIIFIPRDQSVSWKSLNSFAQRWSILFNLFNLLLTILRVNYSYRSSKQLKMFSRLATSCLFASRFSVFFSVFRIDFPP